MCMKRIALVAHPHWNFCNVIPTRNPFVPSITVRNLQVGPPRIAVSTTRGALAPLPTLTLIAATSSLPIPRSIRNAPFCFMVSSVLSSASLLPEASLYSQIIELAPAFICLQLLQPQPVRFPRSLLTGFLLGTLGTLIGSILAAWLPVSTPQLPQLLAAFAATYIGGTLNFIAVANLLDIDRSLVAAAMAVDLSVMAIYFFALFCLAPPTHGHDLNSREDGPTLPKIMFPLVLAFVLCAPVMRFSKFAPGLDLFLITVLSLGVSRVRRLQPLLSFTPSLGNFALNLFFCALGAQAKFSKALLQTPGVLVVAIFILALHATVVWAGGILFGVSRRDLLIASNANVGGPSTAAAFAASCGGSVASAIGVGVLGYVLGTPLGLAVLRIVMKVGPG